MKRYLFILFVLCNLAIFAKSFTYYGTFIRGTDGQMYYAYARSFLLDFDLNFKNEFHELTPYPEKIHGTLSRVEETKTGHLKNKYPIGYGVATIPFFLIAHIATKLINIFLENGIEENGYTVIYDTVCSFGHLIYSLLGLYFCYKFLKKFFREKIVVLALLSVWFGTALLYYASIFNMMAHACGFFCISFLFYLSYRSKDDFFAKQIDFYMISFLCGLCVIIRPTNIIFLTYPFYLILKNILTIRQTRRLPVVVLVTGGLLFLSVISLQFLAWKAIYGSFFKYTYENEGFNFLKPQFTATLFSIKHGFLTCHPIAFLSLAGLLYGVVKRAGQGEPYIFMALLVLHGYILSSWWCPSFGDSFGARNFIEPSIITAFGLCLFYTYVCKHVKINIALSMSAAALNLVLLYKYMFG
ncbi:MAG: hypothetical protein RBU23_03905 [Candidatus Auribacterota bacterium]|nr:hypothetical protein [Candidatus Auribacterota bacterium]